MGGRQTCKEIHFQKRPDGQRGRLNHSRAMNVLFESERLLFRQFTLADAGLFYELNSDPEVVRYVHEPPTTKDNAAQIIRDIILPQYELGMGRWAVFIKDTAEFTGWCGLKYIKEKDETDLG